MLKDVKYSVKLSFEEIKLPPFEDILIVGKNSPHGKNGISRSFEPLIPDGFEVIDSNHENIDCIFVNKRILTKMPKERVVKIIESNVFPYVSASEIIKVDFKVSVTYNVIEDDNA